MNEKDLKRANELTAKIKQLENFVWIIAPEKTERIGGAGEKKIDVIINTTKTITLWGTRNFGCGKHTDIIETPNEMIEDLADLTIKKIEELKRELQEI